MKSEITGYFPSQYFSDMIAKGFIHSKYSIEPSQIQPASLDLRLGDRAFRIRSSFLPDGEKVQDKINKLVMYDFDIRDGAILEKGGVYIIPLLEELKLEDNIHGETNPKSSIGRLDIFTRVVSDYNHRFDEIKQGYNGKIYLQVISRSFVIRVRTGLSLNQLRLFQGGKGECLIKDCELREIYERVPLLYDEESVPISNNEVIINDGIFIKVNLSSSKNNAIIAYKAKKNSSALDLSKFDFYRTTEFWEPIAVDKGHLLILEPEEFYIMMSKEKIRIPPNYVAEMKAYEPNSGELRTHYAGFFDPGFGYGKDGQVVGTKAILEVRPHDVPFLVEDGQTFCKLFYYKTSEIPDKLYGEEISSSYQYQDLTLSKHFYSENRSRQKPLF